VSEEKTLKAAEAGRVSVDFQSQWPALLVIALGSALLVANLFHFHLINVLWPGFIIVPGLMLLWPASVATRDRYDNLVYLAVPGAVITTVGLLLFAMNLTRHYEAWAYSWALIPVAAVAGFMYAKRFDTSSRVHKLGYRFNRFMLLAFMGFAVLFEVVIFGHFTPWLPLGLIAYGLYLLVKDRRNVI
jgi:hypothetical protein